ncbi:thioredoxin-like domain-containing protein [Sphingobacterium sp. R2]|uniref:thioredoxin-like domain-containing protein n=1 Tax=Sphingobacterium sp. R2 TaxID=3112958 RepID=UPI00345DAFF0
MKSIHLYCAYVLSIFLLACQSNGRYPDAQQGKLIASAYEFIDIDGTRHLLKDVKGAYKLLVFYDPEAEESLALIAAMKQSVPLAKEVASGKVNVVAICVNGDLSHWNTYREHIPSQWINGFDLKGKGGVQSYFSLSSFPRLVLLDAASEEVKTAMGLDALIPFLEKSMYP